MEADQLSVVQMDAIIKFLLDEVGQFIIENAKYLKREQAFSFLLPASQLLQSRLDEISLEKLEEDQLLVHGVIDNFVQTSEGLVLIDYKTDRFRHNINLSKEEQIELIIKKYKFQVSLYAQALEHAKGQRVSKAFLVLLDFGETVEVDALYDFN